MAQVMYIVTFYHCFIKEFGTIMAIEMNCLKKVEFQWTKPASASFKEIKKRMTKTLGHRHPTLNHLRCLMTHQE